MNAYIYMEIEDDRYELPVCFADSVIELSELCKVPVSTIHSEMSRARKEKRWCRFIKIPVEGTFKLAGREDKKVLKAPGRKKRMICKVEPNGTQIWYKGSDAAAKAVGKSVQQINKYCRDGKGLGCIWFAQ